ncbi:MAG: tetratricopeptide repeat protein [Candidatus Korobacteraceae bacterium]
MIPPVENAIREGDPLSTTTVTSAAGRRLFLALATIALVYAFLASLRTVSDPDAFWQLATGRWVAQHHHVFSTDVFSYTAQGQPWIYPVGSGLLLYVVYLIGGYTLLSWLGAAGCVGTIALLLRRGSAMSAAIAILAIPLMAGRTAPRADMFTVVLFAAYLSILWQNYQTGRAHLWLLPLLMIAWVNFHLGFVAGLALIVAFVGMDVLELLFPGRRRVEAVQRLRRAWPWFVATALATLANPWGWGIYSALVRQNRAMALHSGWIAEWGSVPLNWTAAPAILSLTSTKGTFYQLLVIAAIAALVAMWQRQFGAAMLLIAAVYLGAQHVRMDALTGCVVIVVGGSFLFSALQQARSRIANPRTRLVLAVAVVAMFAPFVCFRIVNLVTNRNHNPWTFGAGFGWQFPEHAAEFIEHENLPGEVFNNYNEGGYLVWKFGFRRRDYFDGRAIPFGPDSFMHQAELLQTPLDSELWRREAARYNINTIILPLNRFESVLGSLKVFCKSSEWRPVYLDEVAVVLVRRKAETEDLIKRFPVDCSTAPLPAGPRLQSSGGAFNQWANAASVLAALGRNTEALRATDRANEITPDSSFVPWLRGNIFYTMDLRSDAEREYLKAISLEPHEALLWFSLATLYKHEGRIPETISAQQRAIELSASPQPTELLKLAELYLDTKQPRAALDTFDKAVRNATPDLLATGGARSFTYDVALGRASAWRSLGDTKRAASFDDEAVRDLLPQK